MSPMNDPVIHVIDDDDSVRDSLDFLLSSSQFCVKTYDSAAAFLDSLQDIGFGCIITDVRMPGLSGIELLKRLRELQVKIPVIVVTGHGDVPLAVEAMKTGAVDFFEKPFDSDSIVAAVRTALNNSEKDANAEVVSAELRDRLASLTPRERDVLEGLVAGNPNKTIAYDLGISPRTVEIYRANVMTKMKSGSLSELVRIALRAGILSS
jgi:two-component system, LuxR family, response regulator FixJ